MPPKTKSKTATSSKKRTAAKYQFKAKLVLNRLILKLFEVNSLSQLAEGLKREELEGLDQNNLHKYCFALTARTFERKLLTREQLLEFDRNIVHHTQTMNDKRVLKGERPLVWKYFQYLTLLFTEIYLDWYFRDPEGLVAAMNREISEWNADKEEADQLETIDVSADAKTELNKISYWCATGAGKTLIMHTNIHQYRFYQQKYGADKSDGRVILLTPNEGLSKQHIEEFAKSGLRATLFDKNAAGWITQQYIQVIDINKLAEDSGDKTVAVSAFEGNNLVLVDEGHRGASGGADGTWLKMRNALCEKGFSFEYSATFGQAVKGNKRLTNIYARSILFDYSYSYFYEDGFGKHYSILNLDEDTERTHLDEYLIACLLCFYQQLSLFKELKRDVTEFNIEKPLLVFVGSRVTASISKTEASDIVKFLKFLAAFVSDRKRSIDTIERVRNQGLVTADGRNLFAERFRFLNSSRLSSSEIFGDILSLVLNAPAGGSIHIEQIKNSDGEIALRVGDSNEPFGVINVGDAAGLVSILADEPEFVVLESSFGDSLFHKLSETNSPINLLIGSKKFMEGWNSWRVSTMGLMNVGRSEGSQVIQLFGRGVRLKGYNWTLKRSNKVTTPTRPKHLELLETLNIFGIKADYMAQFKAYLEEEGLRVEENQIEILLPVIKNLGRKKLKTIRLKKVIGGVQTQFGAAYREKGPIPTLQAPRPELEETENWLRQNKVVINWYPKIQFMGAPGLTGANQETTLEEHSFKKDHLAFIDIDALFIDLERFKAERGWFNINISRSMLSEILLDRSWYTLFIPGSEMAFADFSKVFLWNEIASALLKKYCEHYYLFKKQAWELPHLEYQELSEDDLNNQTYVAEEGPGYYRCLVDESQEELIAKLQELKGLIERKSLSPWEYRGLKAIWFERHLFQPLLYMKDNIVEIQPVPLNKGELQFIEDISLSLDRYPELVAGRELYLLRNLSRGRGVGFFEAGNFYPDFLLWVVNGDHQKVCFIDPKGISRMHPNDLKIEFYHKIKEIEARLADPTVALESFIISTTPYHVLQLTWRMSKEDLRSRHVLFQEDGENYIRALLEMAVKDIPRAAVG
jgi:hypothetical protein